MPKKPCCTWFWRTLVNFFSPLLCNKVSAGEESIIDYSVFMHMIRTSIEVTGGGLVVSKAEERSPEIGYHHDVIIHLYNFKHFLSKTYVYMICPTISYIICLWWVVQSHDLYPAQGWWDQLMVILDWLLCLQQCYNWVYSSLNIRVFNHCIFNIHGLTQDFLNL